MVSGYNCNDEERVVAWGVFGNGRGSRWGVKMMDRNPEKSFPSPINLYLPCLKPFLFLPSEIIRSKELTNFSLKDKHSPSNLWLQLWKDVLLDFLWNLEGIVYEKNNDMR